MFVDTGLLRQGEPEQVISTFREKMHTELIAVDASDEFIRALKGVTEPEQKRKIIGEKFIRIFEEQARQLGSPKFLVQGTIYPDVVEIVRAGSKQGRTNQNASQRRRTAGRYVV